MSLYVLDTDILTLLQAGDKTVAAKVAAQPPRSVVITVLSVEEQLSGWYTLLRKSKQDRELVRAYQRLADCVRSLSQLTIFDLDLAAIQRYDSLRKLKLNVRKIDLRIAAVVLEKNSVLGTRNVRDFKQVPGLQVEDWSQ